MSIYSNVMKTRLTLLLLLSFSVTAFGQKKPSDYFQEANDYFEEGKLNNALAGYICLLQKKYKKAIEVFSLILNGNQDEREPSGGGIMASG